MRKVFRQKLSQKLRQITGETLIETLVSLLIILLSVLTISTGIMTATQINQKNAEADQAYREALQQAEGQQGSSAIGYLEIRFQSGSPVSVEVDVYGEGESGFVSYDYSPEVKP